VADTTGRAFDVESTADSGDLLSRHDAVLFDLDGTLIHGSTPHPAAAGVLAECRSRGVRYCFVTNNASRSAGKVAEHLRELGLPALPHEVLTSAAAAVDVLQARLGAMVRPARIVVAGGPGLIDAVTDAGMVALVDPPHAPPIDAVVSGLGPDLTWRHLAAASFAVAAGVPWIASNTDLTYPMAQGLAPGNGTLVAAVSAATGRVPEVAGKPEPAMLHAAARRCAALRPLVVGDRTDTDIAAARAAGFASLLVLSGVTGLAECASLAEHQQPTYIAGDVGGLLAAPQAFRPVP